MKIKPLPETKRLYRHRLAIRWRDVDPYNIVHHSIYFVYMEEARWHWVKHLAFFSELNFLTPVMEIQTQFSKSLTYPSEIYIDLFCTAVDTRSMTLCHQIRSTVSADMITSQTNIRLLCADSQTMKIKTMPQVMYQYLKNRLV